MTDLTPEDLRRYRSRLDLEKKDLADQQEASGEDTAPVTLDQQSVGRLSRMDAMQVQAMAKAVEERRRLALTQIEAAIKRIEEGDFGFCVSCDEPIDPRRLDLDPKVATCIACAR